MKSVPAEDLRLEALGVAIGLLWGAAVDLDDEAEAQAYYRHAESLLAAVIRTPARSFGGAKVKAEAVAWACASRSEFGLGATSSERVITSLLTDLLWRPGGT